MDERVEISLSYKRNVSFLKRFAFYRFLDGGDDTWDAQVVQVVFALGEKAGNS